MKNKLIPKAQWGTIAKLINKIPKLRNSWIGRNPFMGFSRGRQYNWGKGIKEGTAPKSFGQKIGSGSEADVFYRKGNGTVRKIYKTVGTKDKDWVNSFNNKRKALEARNRIKGYNPQEYKGWTFDWRHMSMNPVYDQKIVQKAGEDMAEKATQMAHDSGAADLFARDKSVRLDNFGVSPENGELLINDAITDMGAMEKMLPLEKMASKAEDAKMYITQGIPYYTKQLINKFNPIH